MVRLPLANDKKSPLQDLESCTRVWLGKTPLANGKEKSCLKHIGSFTGVWLGKTPLLLMGTKKDVCNVESNALEFGWVRLPPC